MITSLNAINQKIKYALPRTINELLAKNIKSKTSILV